MTARVNRKTLGHLGLDNEQAEQVLALIEGDTDPMDYPAGAGDALGYTLALRASGTECRVRSQFAHVDLVMHVLDEHFLSTHGIKGWHRAGHHGVSYASTGDLHALTIAYTTEDNTWHVAGFVDLTRQYPQGGRSKS